MTLSYRTFRGRPLSLQSHERLLASIGRHYEHGVVLSQIDSREIQSRRMLFRALWKPERVVEVLEDVLAGRQLGFAVGRAVFTAALLDQLFQNRLDCCIVPMAIRFLHGFVATSRNAED